MGTSTTPLKAIYFADSTILEHHGHQIYNDLFCALPHNLVPQAAYDATSGVEWRTLLSDLDNEVLRRGLHCKHNTPGSGGMPISASSAQKHERA